MGIGKVSSLAAASVAKVNTLAKASINKIVSGPASFAAAFTDRIRFDFDGTNDYFSRSSRGSMHTKR